jgi:hypothetical protein
VWLGLRGSGSLALGDGHDVSPLAAGRVARVHSICDAADPSRVRSTRGWHVTREEISTTVTAYQ